MTVTGGGRHRSRMLDAWILITGLAGLGAVVDAAATTVGGATLPGPLAGVTAATTGAPVLPTLTTATAAGAAAALLLVWLRAWPVALLGGSLLTLPAIVAELVSLPVAAPEVLGALSGLAAPAVPIAVLAAAQQLVGTGTRPGAAGQALVGATAGAVLAGAMLVAVAPTGLVTSAAIRLALGVVATAGGLAAVFRLGLRSGRRPSLLATLAGLVAAVVLLAPAAMTADRVAGVLQVSAPSLERRAYVLVALDGIVMTGAGALLAVAVGLRSALAAAVAALAQVGVIAAMTLLVRAFGLQPAIGAALAVLGVAIGCGLATTRWRAGLAAVACVALAAAVMVLWAATGAEPEKVVFQGRLVPSGLLLVLVAATVSVTVAAVAPVLAARGALPAVLGPIVALLVLGGGSALTLAALDSGLPESTIFAGAHHMPASAALLVLAAVGVAALGWLHPAGGRRAVPQERPEPADRASAET